MPSSEFSMLLADLEEASFRRRMNEFRKATANADWMSQFWREHRAAPRDTAALNNSLVELETMAKAQQAVEAARPATQRQSFDRAYSAFRESAAAGRLTAVQAARLEAGFHRLAQGLR